MCFRGYSFDVHARVRINARVSYAHRPFALHNRQAWIALRFTATRPTLDDFERDAAKVHDEEANALHIGGEFV